jgi:uncharacterized protein (TIGR02145 family)
MKNFKKDIFRTASDFCEECTDGIVQIGTQWWSKCNLKVTTYKNGDVIPEVSDQSTWATLTTGAWCHYNNNPLYDAIYGKLYNWHAVNDPRGLAPNGYHIPSDAEWTILTDYLGGLSIAGGKLKEPGFCHWNAPNNDATNSSLFTALPGGYRTNSGSSILIGNIGNWWSSTESAATTAWYRNLNTNYGYANRATTNKLLGISVRVVKDECLDCTPHNVTIGTQVWTGCNANIAVYRDNTVIPYVDDATQWSNLTTGAWCHYDNDPANEPIYGKLYNWYAIAGVHDTASLTDPLLRKQFAPAGWHIPTKDEFTTLTNFVGGLSVTGTKLKEIGDCHWLGGSGATDDYGFTALPAGWRLSYGPFNLITTHCNWWSSTEFNGTFTWGLNLSNGSTYGSIAYMPKKSGLSVRFVEDACFDCIAHDVNIGTQTWTGCNANTKFYNNGDPIPYVDNNTTWVSLTTGAWCYYNNDPASEATYGLLYNWFAANDVRGIAPTGWHLPSDAEWTILTDFLGGESIAGGKMKEVGLCHWNTPNTDATNTSLFTGVPGGFRNDSGYYYTIGSSANWWSSTVLSTNTDFAQYRYLTNNNGAAYRNVNNKKIGLSLRFVKDVCLDCTAGDVVIDTQTWSRCNLNVSSYRNGDLIPEVTDPTAWASLTTGAWCWYANDSNNGITYGKLYNWHAVNDARGLAPFGYHIPSKTEWDTLSIFLGGSGVAGGKIKETGFCHWISPNTNAVNTSNFQAYGAGLRNKFGTFANLKVTGTFWSTTLQSGFSDAAWFQEVYKLDGNLYGNYYDNVSGLSVRVIKDAPVAPACPDCVAADINIDGVVWNLCNTNITKYRDNTDIPQITNNTDWYNATTGAWCWYNNDPANESTYGKLYNFYAIQGIHDAASLTDPSLRKQFAPSGYHVPTEAEFFALNTYLGGDVVSGGAIKEVGTCHWQYNNGATNSSLFTALPGGARVYNGAFDMFKTSGYWWTSSENPVTSNPNMIAFTFQVSASQPEMYYSYKRKSIGASVRFIKD